MIRYTGVTATKQPATKAALDTNACDLSLEAKTPGMIFIDVSDFLFYLRVHTTLSGIQRVQCEIVRNLLELDGAEAVRFLTIDGSYNPCLIETASLLEVLSYIASSPVVRTELDQRLDRTASMARAASVGRDDTFLSIGAFWGVPGARILQQRLKNAGVRIGLYIHDILNITNPEYFSIPETNKFIKGFIEATTYADFILTTSQYNKAMLTNHLQSRMRAALPVDVVPLGHGFLDLAPAAVPETSGAISDIANSDFVLCVGTIEVRKNPTYPFNIWRSMVRAGRKNTPKLVFAGRLGWLVQDFAAQLRACDNLGGRIVLLHNVTDVELAELYRKCLLTIFPSFAEGWGLPVGESIAHGKICIASNAGAIPEVAGELADYVDPYNVSDGLRVLSRYLDDPDLRRRREAEIAKHFKVRSWREVAKLFLGCVRDRAAQIEPAKRIAAVDLPSDRFLPVTSDGSKLQVKAIEGDLSADLVCVFGWRRPEIEGAWADERRAAIRFRANAPTGTSINLMLRLRGPSSGPRIVRIRSGSGSETGVSLNGSADSLAVLPCKVELDNLVSAVLSLEDGTAADEDCGPPYWLLKGLLYVRSADESAKGPTAGPRRPQTAASMPPPPTAQQNPVDRQRRIKVRPARLDGSRRPASLDEFLSSADSQWPFSSTSHRDAPIFADHADKQIFFASRDGIVGPVTEQITLVRRSGQYVSTLRFSEGSVFDASGVSRGEGYLQESPTQAWLSRNEEGTWVSAEAIAAAPYYDQSCLIFYNGNLHNYYHWVVEGLLPLNILSQTFGRQANLQIALPRSRHIHEVLDHSASLSAVGLDGHDITNVSENLIKVREAIWIDGDVIQLIPAQYLRDFQGKVATLHARSRSKRKRRLLIARKGPTRMIDNLRAVRSLLSKYGFETVYLENMRVVDQIVLFQNAEFVVSPHGAGLANLLFCDPGTKVIEFMPTVEMRPFFWLISEKLGLIHGMQFCTPANGKGFQAAVNVDVGKLDALYRMVDAHR